MIEFTLPTRQSVEITIYSVLGENIVTLVNSTIDSGSHQASIPVDRLSTGAYIVRMVVEDGVMERTMVFVH